MQEVKTEKLNFFFLSKIRSRRTAWCSRPRSADSNSAHDILPVSPCISFCLTDKLNRTPHYFHSSDSGVMLLHVSHERMRKTINSIPNNPPVIVIGGMIADQYLGKINTILAFSAIYMVGLIILTATSAPAAIENGAAFPGFVVAIVIIGLGTGGIKANVSPLVAEQYNVQKPYVRVQPRTNWLGRKQGDEVERVIVTPQATYQKLFNMFYWGINVGSLSAIFTTLMESHIGFWPAYLLPTCMFIPGILVVLLGKKIYRQHPPRGSIFLEVRRSREARPRSHVLGFP